MSKSVVSQRLLVIGAGGFGREVLDVVDAINVVKPATFEVIGVADDGPTEHNLQALERRGVAFVGDTTDAIRCVRPCAYSIGIGSPAVRAKISAKFDEAGWVPATLVHPTATMGFDVQVAPGGVLCAGVRLTTNIRIGRHVHINLNSTVGHDSAVGNFVSVNPLAQISGDCFVGEGALIGAGATILNGLTVGAHAVVGANACAVRDVPSRAVVKGVPAK